jgi:hypothetical protein
MKVVKTIDAQEKSMQKVFDALTKHIEKYPDDLGTLYVGRKIQIEGEDILQSSCFIFQNNEQHFFKSHIWHLYKLMEASSLDGVKYLYNAALEIYKKNNEL